MGNTVVYTWPKAATTAVSTAQTTVGAGTLKIDGTLANQLQTFATFPNQMRVVSLTTSGHDLSAIDVTITGTLNGAVVSETRKGPNNTTVETTQLFDSVTSVTTGGTVTAMSVGTGSTGQTKWLAYNTYSAYGAMAVACVATTTINYSLQVTDDDVQTVASPTVFTPVTTLTGATGSILAAVTPLPIRYVNIIVNSSSGNGAVVASFIQQGIQS